MSARLCECRRQDCALCSASDIVADMLTPRVVMKADDLSALMKGVRPMLVRALTAHAWAVAINVVALFSIEPANTNQYRYDNDEEMGYDRGVEAARNQAIESIASLPAPADLVAALYGTLP